MNFTELKALGKALVSGQTYTMQFARGEDIITEELSREAMNKTFVEEIAKLCNEGPNSFERYKLDLFDLIMESVDVKMPKEIERWFEGFAETYQYGYADKPEITVNRARKYLRERATVTQVSRAGVYEVFKLPKEGNIDVSMKTVGGAAQISYSDLLVGRVDWNLLVDILTMGIEDRVYDEILAAFNTIEANLPANNKAESANFEAKSLEKVMASIQPYGNPVIFCTEVFAREITEGSDWASEEEKKARRNVGYLANYKGAKIVILPQTWEDETNTKKKVDDSKAYILPDTGDKPIKICFQGGVQVRDNENNADWSKEIHMYQSMAAVILASNDIGTYKITSLADE